MSLPSYFELAEFPNERKEEVEEPTKNTPIYFQEASLNTEEENIPEFIFPKQEEVQKKNEESLGLSQEDFVKNLKEIPPQLLQGTALGFGGTYGDILDLLGIQSKERLLPGAKTRSEMESAASDAELINLVGESDILPDYARLPSTAELSELGKKLGLIKEPETVAGRLSNRFGQFVGGSTALAGSPNISSSLKAASAGQILEEIGAPEWVQAAGEILTFLKSNPSKTPLTSKSPEMKKYIQDLRKLGYEDKEITLAVNALEGKGFLKKIARPTKASDESFKSAISQSEKSVEDILNKSFLGFEKGGIEGVKKEAAKIFDETLSLAEDVIISKPQVFQKEGEKVIDRLRRTLANTPQEEQVIGMIEKAINASAQNLPADYFIRFYQGLNQIGNWTSPKQREHVFSLIKEAVKDTFKSQGIEGEKLAKNFDRANQSWVKFKKAEDVIDIINKSSSSEGINFSKLSKSLENPYNYQEIVEGLGKQKAESIKKIANAGKDIGELSKSIEGGMAKQILGAGKLFKLAKGFLTLDFKELSQYIVLEAGGKLATKFLTDPKYQNNWIKLIDSAKKNKWNSVKSITTKLENDLEKDGFLNKDQ